MNEEKRHRPNNNYILQVMRDGDMADPWGTAMAWAFACAENLAAIGDDVPSELGYRMSLGGPVIESYEDFAVAEFLGAYVDHEAQTVDFLVYDGIWTDDMAEKVEAVKFAARCLSRYLDWCKAAGRDY